MAVKFDAKDVNGKQIEVVTKTSDMLVSILKSSSVTTEKKDGYSGEGEHRFRREAERRSGVKVNSSRSEATLGDDCAVSVRHRQARLSGAKRRSGSSGDLGCRGKGQQPLCPCFLHGEEVTCIA